MTEESKKILPVDVPAATDTPLDQDAATQPTASPDAAPKHMVNGPISFAGRAGTGAIHTMQAHPVIDPLPDNNTAQSAVPTAELPTTTDNSANDSKGDPTDDTAGPFTAPARDDTPITLAPLEIPQPAAATKPAAAASPPPTPAPPVGPGPAEHAFHALSFVALLSLAVLLAMQQFASVYLPSFFLPSELATAGLYEKMLATGQWLVPPHSDSLPAALPVYFWFVRLVDAIPYADADFLYPLVSAASAFVALAGVYALGLATGLGNRVSFAAGLLLLSSTAFSTLSHFLSPHLFFAGVLALSMACLYRGWVSKLSFVWLALGFMLAAISTLTGGLMGLVIPLLSSLVFVVWRGAFRRAHQLDAVFGFALLLIILLGWLGAIILLTGESAYIYTLTRQIFAPFLVPLWPPQDAWWLYAVRLPVALLPWVLMLFFVPWGRVCATAWPRLKASRSPEASEATGAAWLWIALTIGCLYLCATSSKPCLAFAPLLPLAALLLAKALLHLPQPNSRCFFMVLALLFALLALVLGAVSVPLSQGLISPYAPETLMTYLEKIQGLPLMALVCAFAALILWKFTRRALPAGALMVTVLMITMLVQPAVMMISPSLQGSIAAPQAQPAPEASTPTPASPTAPAELPANAEPSTTADSPTTSESATPAPQPAPALDSTDAKSSTELGAEAGATPEASQQPAQENSPPAATTPPTLPTDPRPTLPPPAPEAAPATTYESPADGLRLSPPVPAEKQP